MNICLSMIVKNEAHVIERVLTSVLPLIDSWTIVDTGSTDSTREIIQAFFERHNVPGGLHHFEWTGNFSEARNFALRATEESGADYGFWIDADEEMFIGEAFNRESAFAGRKDAYCITTRYSPIEYNRKNIWKTGLGFVWTGPSSRCSCGYTRWG
jgi:glycosyltransferase involved in cell wall biosynthesis